MGYEFVRPQSYWDKKNKEVFEAAQTEIKRLQAISERQSVMLALALKEKNDLLNKRSDDAAYWEKAYHQLLIKSNNTEEQLRISGLDLRETQSQLHIIKTLASDFMTVLGIK